MMGALQMGSTAARYQPPRSVATTTLVRLLGDARKIPASQQARLGLEDGGGEGAPLWCAGDVSLVLRPCVAIVGTRKVSAAGAARARGPGTIGLLSVVEARKEGVKDSTPEQKQAIHVE